MSDTKTSSSGVGFTGLLQLLFLGLKLTGHIDWSWWWVLSPVLFTVGLLVFIAFVFLVARVIVPVVTAVNRKLKPSSRSLR